MISLIYFIFTNIYYADPLIILIGILFLNSMIISKQENKDTIVIADEIGNGIVPLDAFEREYREQTGRAEILLAKKADEVVRVICGIGQKIK